jgi:hypothetical protein
MKISNTHQALSNFLSNPEVLKNPEPFLGPNWETVLRWWLYYESITHEQWEELWSRYDAIDHDTFYRAGKLALNAAVEVIDRDNIKFVYNATSFPDIAYELIAMHLLIERGQSLTFVPLIKDL